VSDGVLIFAINNDTIDYVKQSIFCAKRVKKYLGLPVTIVTNSVSNFEEYPFYTKYVDDLINVEITDTSNYKNFSKGTLTVRDKWHNFNRVDAYRLSPYTNTLLIDSDYILNNKNFLQLFNSNKDFLIAKKYRDLSIDVNIVETKISKPSIPMYWATVVYFQKGLIAESIFNFAEYVRDHWSYHRTLYNISSLKFRNDYAFSIAVHMMNGFTEAQKQFTLPFALYNSFDTDVPLSITPYDTKVLSTNRENHNIHYFKNQSVHLMNKFELNKLIDEDFLNE